MPKALVFTLVLYMQMDISTAQCTSPAELRLAEIKAPDCTRPLDVCIAPWSTMVSCSADQQENTYTGYEVELFKEVAWRAGLQLGRDFHFRCLSWPDLRSALRPGLLPSIPGVNCDVSAAGLFMLKVHTDDGVRFATIPTFTSETLIMVLAGQKKWTMSESISIFDNNLWIFLVGCAVLSGLLIFMHDKFEALYQKHSRFKKNDRESKLLRLESNAEVFAADVADSIVAPLASKMSGQKSHARGSKIVYGFYGLVLLTLHAIWSSQLTASMTLQQQDDSIRSLDDLPNKRIGVYHLEVAGLEDMGILKHRVKLVPLHWRNSSDEDDFLAAMRDQCGSATASCSTQKLTDGEKPGKLDALLIDGSLVYKYAFSDCDIRAVPSPYKKTFQGLAFPRGTPDPFIKAFSDLLLDAQMAGDMQEQENQFYYKKKAETARQTCGEANSFAYEQVQGLAIVFYIGVGATCMSIIGKTCYILSMKYCLHREEEKEPDQAAKEAGGIEARLDALEAKQAEEAGGTEAKQAEEAGGIESLEQGEREPAVKSTVRVPETAV